MNFFNFLKKQPIQTVNGKYEPMETYMSSTDTSGYYSELYESEVIRNCVRIIVEEVMKSEPKHYLGAEQQNGEIQGILNRPCDSMDLTTFLSLITSQYLLKNNTYILKYYNKNGTIKKVLPILPKSAERKIINGKAVYSFEIYDESGEINTPVVIDAENVIHLKRDVTTRRFMGGVGGYEDQKELLEYATAYKKLNENLQKSTKLLPSVYIDVIPGVSKDEQIALVDNFVKTLTEKGYAITDARFKVIEGNIETKAKQETTIEHIKYYEQVVCDHFKVPEKILHGTYTQEEYQNFFNLTIKPILKIFSDAFTNAFFTIKEQRDGHTIQFFENDLWLMSISEKRAFLKDTNGMALMTINEQRRLIGLPPVKNGDRILQTLNVAEIGIIDDYQLSKKNKKGAETDEQND